MLAALPEELVGEVEAFARPDRAAAARRRFTREVLPFLAVTANKSPWFRLAPDLQFVLGPARGVLGQWVVLRRTQIPRSSGNLDRRAYDLQLRVVARLQADSDDEPEP